MYGNLSVCEDPTGTILESHTITGKTLLLSHPDVHWNPRFISQITSHLFCLVQATTRLSFLICNMQLTILISLGNIEGEQVG